MLVNPEPLNVAVATAMHQAQIAGLALAVVADDTVTYHAVRGAQDTRGRAPITPTTLFQAASLSKPVFAYRVLQLVDAGRLALDISAQLIEAVLGHPLIQPAFTWLLPFDAWTATPTGASGDSNGQQGAEQ